MLPLYLLSTVLMIGYAAVFTLLAQMRTTFGFSETALGVIAASAFVAGFVAQIGLSRFADSGQGGLMMRLGLVMALLGAAWMCFAESLTAWVLARMMLGFGAGCVRPGLRRLAFILNPEHVGETLGRLAAWEMVGFLVGPVLSSVLFELAGFRAPFLMVAVLLLLLSPFVFKTEIPGSAEPMKNPMMKLIKRPAMQSCLAFAVAFYLAVGVFDAIWAVFIADLGASQLFIGITMSAFTLPMILIAPWAGGFAARRHVLNLLTVTLSIATFAMFTYGFITSIWWMCVPLVIHAVVDAISMPASQLAVGYASGENALAAGQGLFGATGLIVAAIASIAGGYLYQQGGATVLWLVTSFSMLACIGFARWRGGQGEWDRPLHNQSGQQSTEPSTK